MEDDRIRRALKGNFNSQMLDRRMGKLTFTAKAQNSTEKLEISQQMKEMV